MFFELLDLEAVISSAIAKDITVLFSAGNGHFAFPASHPDVIIALHCASTPVRPLVQKKIFLFTPSS